MHIALDIERGKRVADVWKQGVVFVNYLDLRATDLSFGGVKRPGDGNELSHPGLEEFCEQEADPRFERAPVSGGNGEAFVEVLNIPGALT